MIQNMYILYITSTKFDDKILQKYHSSNMKTFQT